MTEQQQEISEEDYQEYEGLTIPGQGQANFQPPYSAELFQDKFLLRRSPYQEELLDLIIRSALSVKAKKVLINTVKGHFDSTIFLSNAQVRGTGAGFISIELRLKIVMNLNILAMKRSDRMNPELVNIEQVMLEHFAFIISRTVGGQRERAMQNSFTSVNEQKIVDNDNENIKPKKRGFFGRG